MSATEVFQNDGLETTRQRGCQPMQLKVSGASDASVKSLAALDQFRAVLRAFHAACKLSVELDQPRELDFQVTAVGDVSGDVAKTSDRN